MPYSRKAKYRHIRRRNPKNCEKGTYANVPISHVKTRKKYKKGTRAVVCRDKKTGKWVTQSIQIPKKGRIVDVSHEDKEYICNVM